MIKNDVTEKLNNFLTIHPEFSEESDVIYVLVQIRKILDHDKGIGTSEFVVLRFYCDWIVHTKKDRVPATMKLVIDELLVDVKLQMQNPARFRGDKTRRFIYFDSLRDELRNFLQSLGVNLSIVDSGWIPFVKRLVKILEDQPICSPSVEIESISFQPAADGCTWFEIKFVNDIHGYPFFRLGNAY